MVRGVGIGWRSSCFHWFFRVYICGAYPWVIFIIIMLLTISWCSCLKRFMIWTYTSVPTQQLLQFRIHHTSSIPFFSPPILSSTSRSSTLSRLVLSMGLERILSAFYSATQNQYVLNLQWSMSPIWIIDPLLIFYPLPLEKLNSQSQMEVLDRMNPTAIASTKSDSFV